MAEGKAYLPEAASLPGRKYREDKPVDCGYCYWWKPGKKCCEREECFYLLPPDTAVIGLGVSADMPEGVGYVFADSPQPDTYGDCRYCPYGKHSPCIGFCLAKILYEMGVRDG